METFVKMPQMFLLMLFRLSSSHQAVLMRESEGVRGVGGAQADKRTTKEEEMGSYHQTTPAALIYPQ